MATAHSSARPWASTASRRRSGTTGRTTARLRHWAAEQPAPERPAEQEQPGAEDWRHRAACAQEDPELFFPVGTGGSALRQTERAKTVCHGCPVLKQCLSWALESGQEYGVWGGTGEEERRAMKRRAARERTRGAH
ncbi:transcription factor WhiB [Kitasatospora sp. SolWspMP-SS2h]|nr:transcription factor WhiB [Kitasatospora sp. SolWspMP-SS2h]